MTRVEVVFTIGASLVVLWILVLGIWMNIYEYRKGERLKKDRDEAQP